MAHNLYLFRIWLTSDKVIEPSFSLVVTDNLSILSGSLGFKKYQHYDSFSVVKGFAGGIGYAGGLLLLSGNVSYGGEYFINGIFGLGMKGDLNMNLIGEVPILSVGTSLSISMYFK